MIEYLITLSRLTAAYYNIVMEETIMKKKDFTGTMVCPEGIELYVYEAVVYSPNFKPWEKDYYAEREIFLTKKAAKEWAKDCAELQFAQYKQPYKISIEKGHTTCYKTIDNVVKSCLGPIIKRKRIFIKRKYNLC